MDVSNEGHQCPGDGKQMMWALGMSWLTALRKFSGSGSGMETQVDDGGHPWGEEMKQGAWRAHGRSSFQGWVLERKSHIEWEFEDLQRVPLECSAEYWWVYSSVRRLVDAGERTTQRIRTNSPWSLQKAGVSTCSQRPEWGHLTTLKMLGIRNTEGLASVLGKMNPRRQRCFGSA